MKKVKCLLLVVLATVVRCKLMAETEPDGVAKDGVRMFRFWKVSGYGGKDKLFPKSVERYTVVIPDMATLAESEFLESNEWPTGKGSWV
ncbi:hypothetical protein HDE_05408 [Halotydeus destructor]|nr:hypothetical protein HDE_05408 [Halotydeus destructor]